jgi:GNAT superfamily N-acetyltransferase
VTDVRTATLDQTAVLTEIVSRGFYDDPVMRWVLPDDADRLAKLRVLFEGLVRDFVPDRGTVHLLDDATATFWRSPSFDHAAPPGETDTQVTTWPADVLERLATLGAAMVTAHPHEPHWYLNVISTLPDRQGQGLGARVLAPVLAVCDAEGIPAYLESSNPRNMTLYRRQGFEQTGEIPLPDGPSLYPMWRNPA